MKVAVTQARIDMGDHAAGSCPVALAMSHAGCAYPAASRHTLSWTDKGEPRFMSAPRSVAKFIKSYDARRDTPPKPFSFNLEDE